MKIVLLFMIVTLFLLMKRRSLSIRAKLDDVHREIALRERNSRVGRKFDG